jgi:hypothetical protein
MKRLIALAAALGLLAAACGGAQLPLPPLGEATPTAGGQTPQAPATPAPPALDTAELEALAREFVPPGAVQQTVYESAESYQIHMKSEMSLGELEAHWRQVAGSIGMSIESVIKSDEMVQINLTGRGTSYGWVMAMTVMEDITVSIVMGTD